ncbi:SEC24-like protein A, COPII coat complex component [Phyllostomus discolor]|uniref:Protein transport protein Sec24A isoform X2 n=1 Tax=Phyllostomus discolor TaxID=89673 RepID=A0A6J2MZ37_9CHIR|nr:protein transport protein Sec24A isoform X2 [Phyllostomus discolor]KAF6082884.1 SEC24-like protein A, COPII coat complex component [Phyllostomus discolor]
MSQPGIPAPGGALTGLQAQNGAASASGSPYTNGPIQNELMSSQGYNSQPPGSYSHLIPAKTLNPISGQSKYSGSQTVSPLSNYQGPGQTLHRPPVASNPVTPSLHSGPVPRMPQHASQNPAATPVPSGSFHPGAIVSPPSNWQYNYPSTGSQTNHGPLVSSGPAMPGNTNLTSHQYVSSRDPSLQNNFIKSGSAPPLVNSPLPTTFQPGAPLGPPPMGGPPPVRALTTQKSSQGAGPQSSFSSAVSQEGITSSTNNGSMVVHNSYDEIEGGGFLATPQLTNKNTTVSRSVGYSYPALPPGYQNTALPGTTGIPPSSLSYPSGPQAFTQPPLGANHLTASMSGLSLHPEGLRVINLLQERNMLPSTPLQPPVPNLHEDIQRLNCNPELFRCTLTNIPQTQALLNKAKLPLGLLLHPFKDPVVPVVTSSTIVRCRMCRTYINPFVSFLDQRRWKCNLCYQINDVPEEFMYNPLTRVYGESLKRPEVQNATIEFMAPSEYMLRPPQPPVYLFVFDVSHNAVETGYLNSVCQSLLNNLDLLPGNTRTKIGFITFDSTIHFYSLQEGLSQPQMLIVSDIEDVFIPMPENLLVNLNESKELVQDLLKTLPQMFTKTLETQSALGPALQAAFKLMSPTGGRMSVFQTQLPTLGVGALKPREEPNHRSSAKEIHLTPSTDFYKKLALDCSGQQVAVDLFLLSGQYSDLASLGCISRYSAGSVYYYPSYHHQHNPVQVQKLQKELQRYLTRKIGFEAVMRIRCTKGLSIHTFHGNFFVRSTDLLSLPNVNPDAGYAVQMSVEESLTDTQLVSFQSALLYTSSKGERRIRVHTLCLPVVSTLNEVFLGADVQAISGLLANMAVDRSLTASLSDARDALVNAVIDSLSAYRSSVLGGHQPGLMVPFSLRLFPLFVLALLKQKSFQTGTNARLDERIFAMCQVKNQPLVHLMLTTHPNLYRVDNLSDEGALNINDRTIPQPPILQLSVEKLSRDGAFLMDASSVLMLWVGKNCGQNFLSQVLGVQSYASIPHTMTDLPELDTPESARTIAFISWLREQRPFFPILYVIRDESPMKANFLQNMVEDRTESALSYYEFLLHIQQQVNK